MSCNKEYSHLLFESLDSDKSSRTFSPIIVTDIDTPTVVHTIDSFSHKAPNILLGVMRLSRFPVAIETDADIPNLKLNYTGTQPMEQRFKLASVGGSTAAVIVIIEFYE